VKERNPGTTEEKKKKIILNPSHVTHAKVALAILQDITSKYYI
jgi:3-dehydroquinate dehydratase